MNSKERLELCLRGSKTDRLPYSPFLAYIWETFPDDIKQAGELAFFKSIGADPLWRGAPCPVREIFSGMEKKVTNDGNKIIIEIITPVGTLREIHTQTNQAGNTFFLTEHPLKSEEDFKIRLWIEEHRNFVLDLMPVAQHFSANGREGLSIGMLIPRMKTSFQAMVENLVGTEELTYAFADFPETVEELLQKMVENDLKAVLLAVESDYDFFLTWEDSGTQNYSPTQYLKYIFPEITQWCQILSKYSKFYIQHACGHVNQLLELMRKSGICAIESISTMPTGNVELKDARKALGAEIGIIGGIEPTQFLSLTLKQLAIYTENVIASASGGPFILGNSDSCPPGISIEKFKLVAEIASKFKN